MVAHLVQLLLFCIFVCAPDDVENKRTDLAQELAQVEEQVLSQGEEGWLSKRRALRGLSVHHFSPGECP